MKNRIETTIELVILSLCTVILLWVLRLGTIEIMDLLFPTQPILAVLCAIIFVSICIFAGGLLGSTVAGLFKRSK